MDHSPRRVTLPSAGETLTGVLFRPQGPAAGRLPAVVIAGGQTCVKEQMAQVYAERLAARDQILAFRLAGHHLDRRLPPGSLLAAAAAC